MDSHRAWPGSSACPPWCALHHEAVEHTHHQGDDARLWNLAPLIPADQRHSRTYNGRPELIDHFLVSHAPELSLVGAAR